jgi:hypothetical protein
MILRAGWVAVGAALGFGCCLAPRTIAGAAVLSRRVRPMASGVAVAPVRALAPEGLSLRAPAVNHPRSHRVPVSFGLAPRTAVVMPGDTVWRLASRYGSPDARLDDTVEEILQLNHLRDDATLLPGQLIQLPGR